MHRGELAYIKKNYIRLPEYFLKSLNLEDGSRMTGLYYPNNYTNKIKNGESETEDVIFSPIPFNFWPFTFRLSLKIDEKVGTIESITNTLKSLGVNILLCDCHKAGYRYNIWFLILNSVDMQTKYSNNILNISSFKLRKPISDLQKKIENEMNSLRENIERAIFNNCKEALFLFENESEKKLKGKEKEKKIRDSYTIKTGKTLPYHFWKYHIQNLEVDSNQFPYFDCIINNNKIEFDRHSLSSEFLEKIGLAGNDSQTNSFVNVHTTATRIRVSIVPKHQNELYKKLIIKYSVEKSSIGYLNKVANLLKENSIKVLNINNTTSSHTDFNETGSFELIIKINNIEMFSIQEKLKDQLNDAITCHSINIQDIYKYKIFISIQSNFFLRQSVLDIIYEIGKEFGLESGIKGNFIVVENNVKSTEQAVIDSLRECDGFFQLLIDFSKNNDYRWLEAEYLTAKTLNIPIVRVKDKNSEYDSKIDAATNHFEIGLTDNDLEKTKDILRQMLKELLNSMKNKNNSFYSTH